MKIDILTQYCIYNDYPLFRLNLARYRDHFNKVILYPSRHHGVIDLEAFAKKTIQETWVDPVAIDYGVEDWRQAETTPMLQHSDGDWLLFMEQDFFVDNWEKLFTDVEKEIENGADAIGWWNETAFPYLHPCFFLLKREMFEKTQKDFRAHPEIPGCDHFAMLTRDVERLGGKIVTLQSLGWENWKNAFHLGGLTYVYQDWKDDGSGSFGVGNPEAFFVYNYWSRHANVLQNTRYLDLSVKVENHLRTKFLTVHLRSSDWKRFFI